MNKSKRGLAFLLTLMLVMTFIPVPSSLALGTGMAINSISADPVTNLPARLTDGAVWTDKSVSVADAEEGIFNITLSAIGQNYKIENPQPLDCVDVVLVLDTSGSMGDNGKLNSMKAAARQAVDSLLSVSGNRVALIEYAEKAYDRLNFQSNNCTNPGKLKEEINNFVAGNGTNIQDGFLLAQKFFTQRSDQTNKPVIILMTDGDPTYGYSDLEKHNNSTVLGNGASYETADYSWQLSNRYKDGTIVWQTVKQAMHAKEVVKEECGQELDIYTIGFGVNQLNDNSKAFALATLQPTDANTASYREDVYSGKSRDQLEISYRSYYRYGNGQWRYDDEPNTPAPGSTTVSYGEWTTFSGLIDEPEDTWGDYYKTGDAINVTDFGSGSGRWQEAWFEWNRTGTDYENVTSGLMPFDHKYWDDLSSITDDGASDILNAFTTIINEIINFKPMAYTVVDDAKVYSDVTITDVLGEGFEVVGGLPAGVSQIGNTLTWTIDAEDFTTLDAGSTSIDADKIHTVSFQVKLSDFALTPGTYYTNASAYAAFNVPDQNPAYATTTVAQDLNNKGQLNLYAPDVHATVTVTKTVEGPVEDENTFYFYLYYNDDCSGEPINTTPLAITVDGDGTESETLNLTIPAIQFNGNTADIYVKEAGAAPQYWDYDDSTEHVAITRDAAAGEAEFTNVYEPKGTLTVNKVWNGMTGSAVTFVVQKATGFDGEGNPVSWEAISAAEHELSAPGWSTEIGGLDLDETYRVQEVRKGTDLQDYIISYDPLHVTLDTGNLEDEITICNDYQTPTGKITVNKSWNHNGNEAEDRPEEVNFAYEGPEGVSGMLKLTEEGGWTNYIEPTVFGEYTFTECVPLDYTAVATEQSITISSAEIEDRSGELTFTNNYVTPSGILSVTKTWTDENDDTSYRPDSLTIRLQKWLGVDDNSEDLWEQAKDANGEDAVAVIQKIHYNESTNLIYTFKNLSWGKYRVVEDGIDDYTAAYSDPVNLEKHLANGDISSREGGYTITNSFNNPTGSITVTKSWVEDKDLDLEKTRPSVIKVSLMAGEEEVESVTRAGIDGPDNWNYTFEGLPLDGTVYTVKETAVGSDAGQLSNYRTSILYGGDCDAEGIRIDRNNRVDEVTVTNTYAKGTITIIKDWADKNNPVSEQPGGADITLWKKVIIETQEEVTSEAGVYVVRQDTSMVDMGDFTVERSKPVVLYNLELGENITYYVTEREVPFYDSEITYSNEDESTTKSGIILFENAATEESNVNGIVYVTNTYNEPYGSLTVEKEWDHGYNPAGNRPDKATIRLYSNGKFITSADISASTGWSCIFDKLPLGAEYTISEDPVAGYVTTYGEVTSYTPVKGSDSVACGEINLKNTYTPATGNLRVEKKWEGTTGGAVEITLTRYSGGEYDGNFVRNITLSEDNGWEQLFTGLELYGPNGLYSYCAEESGDLALYSAGYSGTPSLTANETVTLTVTNTYEPEEKATLVIKKEWLDENGAAMSPDVDSVEVRLYKNGEPEELTMILNVENNWTVTRSGLNADDKFKVEEVIPADGTLEAFVPSYSADEVTFTSGSLTKTLTVTNQRTPDSLKISVEKVLFNPATVLEDGSATFHYAVYITNNSNRTLTDLTVEDVMTASGNAEGADITYTEPVPDDMNGDTATFELDHMLPPSEESGFRLGPDDNTVIYYNVKVDKAGDYSNTATVKGYYDDQEVSATGTAIGTVKAPGLTITKSVGKTVAYGNDGTFSYELIIKNDSGLDLDDVTVEDAMTASDDDAVMTYNSVFNEGDTLKIGALASGEQREFSYTVTMDRIGTYNNTATVSGIYVEQINEEESNTVTLKDSASAKVEIKEPVPDRPRPRPNTPGNTEPVNIDEEQVPESPIPTTPDEAMPEETIMDDAIPAGPLPKTGGVDPMFLYGAGVLLAGGGLFLRRRSKSDKTEK